MIDAMKRALKTFEKIHEGCGFVKEDDLHKDAKNLATYIQEDCDFTMRTLRQAIEQAEKQEPVTWAETNDMVCALLRQAHDVLACASYPFKRPWVGLTDEELVMYSKQFNGISLVSEIEAQLKERNNG